MDAISAVEEKIVSRLKSELSYLRTCDSLSEFLGLDLEELKELTPLLPAVYVVYEAGRYDHSMSSTQDVDMIFNLVVMAANLRGDKAARHGAGAVKGVYAILEDCRAALTEQDCGAAIDPLLPVDEQALMGDRHTAVYGMAFKTRRRVAPSA